MSRLTRALVASVVWVIAGAVFASWIGCFGCPVLPLDWDWGEVEWGFSITIGVLLAAGAWLIYWVLQSK